jgi:hypothetical protein
MKTESRPTTSLDWAALMETALTMPGNVGDTYNRFYEYSFMNQVLLMMQGVREPVATYKRWQSIGRQVLKGSKAKEIVRPIVIEKKDAAGDVTDKLLRFRPVKCLFGYSETEGDELPPVEVPSWHLPTALSNLAIEQIPYDMLDGNTQGFSTGREFAINPVAVNPLKTTFHEIGHIVLGHTRPEQMPLYEVHRGVYEFQAESTAYLVGNELEVLDETSASESRGYIQNWLRGERPSDIAIRQVFSVTDQILKAGRLAVES